MFRKIIFCAFWCSAACRPSSESVPVSSQVTDTVFKGSAEGHQLFAGVLMDDADVLEFDLPSGTWIGPRRFMEGWAGNVVEYVKGPYYLSVETAGLGGFEETVDELRRLTDLQGGEVTVVTPGHRVDRVVTVDLENGKFRQRTVVLLAEGDVPAVVEIELQSPASEPEPSIEGVVSSARVSRK